MKCVQRRRKPLIHSHADRSHSLVSYITEPAEFTNAFMPVYRCALLERLVSANAVHIRAKVIWPENHRGSPNTVREKGNLENVGGKLIPYPPICFHNLVWYSVLGLAKLSVLRVCVQQRYACCQKNRPHVAIFVSQSRVTAPEETSLDFFRMLVPLELSRSFDTNNHSSHTLIKHISNSKGTGCVCSECTMAEVNKDALNATDRGGYINTDGSSYL